MTPQLPEFQIELTKVSTKSEANPIAGDIHEHNRIGLRSKLGGTPDWIQEAESIQCPDCCRSMIFVAQIDSIEHYNEANPHGVDPLSDEQLWMFGDAGMIYVFYCFFCGATFSTTQCY